MSLPSLDDLMSMDIGAGGYTLMPPGQYNGVITNVEVRNGKKGSYLNLEVTIHDDEYRGRKVWRNASFSEKALGMPGGIANLVQSTKPDIPRGITPEQLPHALAQAVTSVPVGVVVIHEDRWKDGSVVINPVTGEAEQRETIDSFYEPNADFVKNFENEAAGIDDDLPF